MQKRVIWSSIAEEKFFLTLNFWNERNLSTEYSNKIIDATEQAEKYLISFPNLGVIVQKTAKRQIRKYLVLDNYSLYYVVHHESIEILAFFDSRNNPMLQKFWFSTVYTALYFSPFYVAQILLQARKEAKYFVLK